MVTKIDIATILFDFRTYNDHNIGLEEWLDIYLSSPDYETMDIEAIKKKVIEYYE